MSNVLLIFLGLTLLPFCVARHLMLMIRLLVLQGLILFGIALLNLDFGDWAHLLLVLLETLVLKMALIPWFLQKTIIFNHMRRDVESYVPDLVSLLAGLVLLLGGFFFANWVHQRAEYVHPLHFGLAFSAIGVGFFLMLSRKKLLTHLIGYMVMENGIFLLSLAVVAELPFLVSLGVLLDIFMMILLSSLFINRIHSTFEDEQLNIEHLTSLKH
ncbi:MAG: hypothetical protein HQM11_09480 [SAR324 cluster bacterium]|nr:hypothetical protein [SAR324 cluster bacterium]